MGPPTTFETKDMLVFKKRAIGTKAALSSHFSPLRMTSSTAKKLISLRHKLSGQSATVSNENGSPSFCHGVRKDDA